MSDITEKHKPTQNIEPFAHEDRVQFSDGRIAFGFMTPGDRLIFDGTNRYANPRDSVSTMLVKTHSGARYALGRGVIIELPELDKTTGDFGKPDQPVKAIALDDIPAGLTDITIGEDWDTLGVNDPVTMVMLDYKIGPKSPDYNQLDMPNPFDSAREHLSRVAQAMQQPQ